MAAMGGKVHKLAVCEGKHEKGADWGVIKLLNVLLIIRHAGHSTVSHLSF